MADVKFTDLSAVSGTPDDGSLLCLSTYDGVSAYTSEKLTLTAAKNIFGNAPTSTDNAIARFDSTAGQLQNSGITIDDTDVVTLPAESKVTFNSSGTNKTVLDDSNSNARLEFNGSDIITISTDGVGTTSDYSKAWLYMDDVSNWLGFGTGTDNNAYFFVGDSSGYLEGGLFASKNGTASEFQPFIFKDNTLASRSSTAVDSIPMMIAANNATVNTGITNAVVAGGVGVTADTDDTLHTTSINRKQDSLSATTGTIDIDSNALGDGAYKKVTATGNITLNATTAHSTNNSARWTLEFTQDAGGTNTLTLGTNFLTPGGVAVSVSTGANDTDLLIFETDSAGKHRLVEHRKAYA